MANEKNTTPLIYSHNLETTDIESRFRTLGINSAIWQFNEDDDDALEGNFSFAYVWFDCRRGQGNRELEGNFDTCEADSPNRIFNFSSNICRI